MFEIVGKEPTNNVQTVASAVEQQGAATDEISRNVQRAAEGTGAVTSSMTQLSQAVDQTSSSADMVLSASGELTEKTITSNRRLRGSCQTSPRPERTKIH